MALFVVIVYSIIKYGACLIKPALFSCCIYIPCLDACGSYHITPPLYFWKGYARDVLRVAVSDPLTAAGVSNLGHFIFEPKGWRVVDH